MSTLPRFTTPAAIVFLLAGLTLGTRVLSSRLAASSRDTRSESLGAAPCAFPLERFDAPRVLSTGESKPATILLHNDGPIPCTVTLTLAAPDFDLGVPPTRSLDIPAGARASVSWVLSPKKAGTYTVSLSTDYHSVTRGIAVTTLFGLNASMAQLASAVSSFLGAMLTLPWWIERRDKRKQAQAQAQAGKPS